MADVEHTEHGSTRRTRGSTSHPCLRLLLLLPAGKPLAHALQTPHGPTEALHALALLLAPLHQLDVRLFLHTANARLNLLQ